MEKIILSACFGIATAIALALLIQTGAYVMGWVPALHLATAALTGFVVGARLVFMIDVFAEYLTSRRAHAIYGCFINLLFFLTEWFIRDFEKGFSNDILIRMFIYTAAGGVIALSIRRGRSLA